MKKIFVFLLMTVFVLAACSASKAGKDQSIETGIDSINKNGSITLTIGPGSMKELGYEPADIILVRIGDAEMEMPTGGRNNRYGQEYAVPFIFTDRSCSGKK